MTSFDAIQPILDAAVEDGAVPGAAAVIVTADGVQYAAHAGAREAGGEAIDAKTIFRFASLTKAVTSVAVLQLVERGKLRMDQELASVLPEFGRLQVLDGFDGDTPILRPPATQATVRQLLTHSGGAAYFFANADIARYQEQQGVPSVLTGEKAALFDMPLASDPGTRWEYGTNVDWLGLAVEELSGLSLPDYLAEHVFGPLGMTETSFAPTAAQRSRLIPVHHRTPDGGLVTSELDWPLDPEFYGGGQGLYGTASDYGRFLSALLGDGEPILGTETLLLMFTDQLGDVPMPGEMISAAPELSNDIIFPPVPTSWGAGLKLTQVTIPGMRHAGTGDWAGIFNLYYWVDRDADLGGVFLTQVLPFFDGRIVEAALGVELAAYAAVGVPA